MIQPHHPMYSNAPACNPIGLSHSPRIYKLMHRSLVITHATYTSLSPQLSHRNTQIKIIFFALASTHIKQLNV
jgi:hypothetical protein